MPSNIIDPNAPALQGKMPKLPQDMPHGLLTPPAVVRETLAREKAKFPPEQFPPEVEERLLNLWTVAYYFEPLMFEALYRQTPDGPEVLAVGFEEMDALREAMPPDELRRLNTWMP
jgi:hypothetical protein